MATTDYRSPAEIENEIEEERRSLTGTLDELQHRFSFDRMTTEAGQFVRSQSGEIATAVSRAVRENPMAVALTGIGIAWMILGQRRGGDGYGSYGHAYVDDDEGYDGTSDDVGTGYADRAAAEGRSRGRYDYEGIEGGSSFADTMSEDDPDWVRGYADVLGSSDEMDAADDWEDDGAPSASDRMKEGFRRAGERMRHGRAGAESRIERARRRLGAMRDRLSHGTEGMGEDARRRILAARERAIEARHELARRWGSQSRAAIGAYDRQPLAAGAFAFAAGAALAAALPRTRIEDEYLGEQSDRLMEEAERIFEEERAKLGRVAEATAEEAKAVMREKAGEAKEGAKSIETEAREAADRVARKAKEEAEKQHLGKPGS